MNEVDAAIERTEEGFRPFGDICTSDLEDIAMMEQDRRILAAEVKRLREKQSTAWDEGYQACLRQWDHPANADRLPARNPHHIYGEETL